MNEMLSELKRLVDQKRAQIQKPGTVESADGHMLIENHETALFAEFEDHDEGRFYYAARRLLAKHGPALIAAVELAVQFDRRASEATREEDADSLVVGFIDGNIAAAWSAYRATKPPSGKDGE